MMQILHYMERVVNEGGEIPENEERPTMEREASTATFRALQLRELPSSISQKSLSNVRLDSSGSPRTTKR